MAFRYIDSDDYVAAVNEHTRKPRLLLVEPQKLFVEGLTRMLAESFEVVVLDEACAEQAADVIVVDADATPIGSLSEVLAAQLSEPAICLLSLTAAPRAYTDGARFHVLSKKMREEDFLSILSDLVKAPPKRSRNPFSPRIPSVSNLHFSSTYVGAMVANRSGGDWYDVFELPNGHVMFSIGDVAGHGIDAALTMSRLRHAMIAAALRNPDPAAVLTLANATLIKQETLFATATCGFINSSTREVVYATAGHPPTILVRPNGSARSLEHSHLMLGVDAAATYRSYKITAEPGSLLVLYTDGVVEHDRDIVAGQRRLVDIAGDVVRQAVLDAASAIQHEIFRQRQPADDAAILTIGFRNA